jgi:formylmethanofuran dehydrogenase subunit A
MIELTNARIVDPLHPRNGQTCSLFVQDQRFVAGTPGQCTQQIDLSGALVLAGGIDLHTHIGGGKTNLARLLTAEVLKAEKPTIWPTIQTGHMYAKMGYTACFEPAMLLSSARHTHLELGDTPLLDHGAYVVLGNEEWLLELLGSQQCDQEVLSNLIAWSIKASRALAVKAVNPGGISAFKFNQRKLNVDTPHPRYGVTPREVIQRLTASIDELGLAHPLHLHASNLGMPGNIQSTLESLKAADGRRIHLTHAQFNCYTDTGPYGMGSGAELLAKYVNEHPNVSLDVGQVIFGQTVTISADLAAQYRNLQHASPKRGWLLNQECQAGCGVVPIRYHDQNYVSSLQWTIGLELMLLVDDPWRIFLTTDHPNGGPFTAYPHLMRLLMDRSFRLSMLERIHPLVAQRSILLELTREYSLDEIAIATRAGPAKILGLAGLGSLRDGSFASLAAYRLQSDWESTFQEAFYVMKSGKPIVQNSVIETSAGAGHCWRADVPTDSILLSRWGDAIQQRLRLPLQSLEIGDEEANWLGRAGELVSGSEKSGWER